MSVRRILTIGHSYVVRRNRELAEAVAAAGQGAWEVSIVAPSAFPGDLGPLTLQREPGEHCNVVPLPVQGARWIHVMRYSRKLRDILSEPWDVVHCWEEPYIVAGWQVARACAPRSALVYATFQNITKRYPPPFNAIERASLRRANGWIAFGRSVERALERRRGYADRPHTVIPFGVDTTRFAPDASARLVVRRVLQWQDDSVPVVGFVGRFVEGKGLPMLVEALRALARRGVAWRALFVGGGPLEAGLRAFAQEQDGRVAVATGVAHDDVPRYLNAMDMLCAPSQTTPAWREQFGRMIVEAFACGVPVVGSDSGEIPHVVGDAGIIVGERDEAGWTRAIEHLLSNADERVSLGQRGRARAEAEFSWRVVGERHLDFFSRIVAQ
ncbi:MAG TPA: glycosyltransferase family 4 protein [Gemmatimonadaceae bacterium]|nr:glycosyltransferase family 4 protein [Gemmatimonadaceae bacterium]